MVRKHQTKLFITLFFSCTLSLFAQEPPPPQPERGRIVTGRPALHSFKRKINPLTWIEAGIRPLGRSAERKFVNKLTTRKSEPNSEPNKVSGVKFNLIGPGSGFGIGPLVTPYHHRLFGRGIEVDVPLMYTFRKYEAYGVNVRVPLTAEKVVNRLSFDFGTSYQSRARDNFAGIGNESRLEDSAHVRTVTREVSVGVSAAMNDNWQSGFRLVYRNTGVTRPRAGLSAQDTFRNADIPGLFTGADIISARLSFDHDTTDKEGALPVTGGREHIEVSRNEGLSRGDFSYWKYRFEIQRFLPLTNDRRKIIAVRAVAETNEEKGGSTIPFFDMPTVGSSDTVRGFQNDRFYGKSAVSAGIEYRYRVAQPLDFALFADVGQVAPEMGDFGIDLFHAGYGIRLIGMPKPNFPVSIDVARSRERWNFYVNFNTEF